MSWLTGLSSNVLNLFRVSRAFLQLSFRQAISYPLRFGIGQLAQFVPIVIFFFVAKMVDRQSLVHGGDYFTFVVIGLIGARLLDAGLRGLSQEFEIAINRGWLEMFLVEPLQWRLLPFGMSLWPIVQAVVGGLAMVLMALALGTDIDPSGIPAAIGISLLGIFAGLAIATLAVSFAVLAKSGDPVLYVYTLAAQVFSGVYFNIEALPFPLRLISFVIPHTYVIQALRKVLLPNGNEVPGFDASTAVLATLAFGAIMYPLAIWMYGRALEYGRKLGILSGY